MSQKARLVIFIYKAVRKKAETVLKNRVEQQFTVFHYYKQPIFWAIYHLEKLLMGKIHATYY